MDILNLHKWNISPKEAIAIQKGLRSRVILTSKLARIRTVAGADMAIDDERKLGFAGVIVYSYPDMEEIERADAVLPLKFPYVPGLLAFREGPILLDAFAKLKNAPDVIMLDGQGIAHPRGLGIASHMGLFLERPTIGCAKSRLVGEYKEPGQNVGDWSPLIFPSICKGGLGRVDRKMPILSAPSASPLQRGRDIGAVLRTRKKCKPVFVSPGHMIDLETSIKVTLACLDRTRIPKPTREADHFVARLKRGLDTPQ